MIAGCVIFAVELLNNEIGANKLSNNLAPHTLITGFETPEYKEVMSLTFGEYYVEVNSAKTLSNTTDAQTIPSIALYTSGNF